LCFPAAEAAEISSNGLGGGPWNDPATWRGKTVPGPDDDVVIAKGDVVIFSSNDDKVALLETGPAVVGSLETWAATAALLTGTAGKVSCQKLYLDPKSVLTFKSGGGKQTLSVAGPIEAFGTIKLDAHNTGSDFVELRLVGDKAEKRTLVLKDGGALLMSGRSLRGGRCNVALTSQPLPALKPLLNDADALGVVEGNPSTMIDLQRAELVHVQLKALSIDNTGAKANERLNVADCRFSGRSRIAFNSCDTPIIANNRFEYSGEGGTLPEAAIYMYACSLAEIRGNTVRGPYVYAISGSAMVDSAVTGNSIENCANGIYWYGANGMIKQNTIRGCDTGVAITSMSGALEDISVDGAKIGLNHAGATAQVTNLQVTNLQKDGTPILYSSGPLTLLNCNFRPEQIKMEKPATPPTPAPPFLVQSLQYVVVGVKGDVPAGSQVELVTANPPKPLPPGALDLNIRNSPAKIGANGLTPLPKSLEPLIVKTWVIGADYKVVPAPEYSVKVLGPAAATGGPRPVLKTLPVKPDDKWFRAKPNEPTPTVEVSLK
jgi:parallel beta-helix repeat protein